MRIFKLSKKVSNPINQISITETTLNEVLAELKKSPDGLTHDIGSTKNNNTNRYKEISNTIREWVDFEAGTFILPFKVHNIGEKKYFLDLTTANLYNSKKSLTDPKTSHVSTEIFNNWVEQAKTIYSKTSDITSWNEKQFNFIQNAFNELSSKRQKILNLHKIGAWLTKQQGEPLGNLGQQKYKNQQTQYYNLLKELKTAKYLNLEEHLNNHDDLYSWVPVQPGQLTQTQYHTLPTNK